MKPWFLALVPDFRDYRFNGSVGKVIMRSSEVLSIAGYAITTFLVIAVFFGEGLEMAWAKALTPTAVLLVVVWALAMLAHCGIAMSTFTEPPRE